MKFYTLLLFFLIAGYSYSQGILNGTVNDAYSGKELHGIIFELKNTSYKATSDNSGRFRFIDIPQGIYTLVYIADENLRYENYQTEIEIINKKERIDYVNLTPVTYKLDDIYVYGVTKTYEKVTESPAAVVVLYQDKLNTRSRGNQLAGALTGLSGVDVLKNGSSDFIVNARGFNAGLNRRVPVLQD